MHIIGLKHLRQPRIIATYINLYVYKIFINIFFGAMLIPAHRAHALSMTTQKLSDCVPMALKKQRVLDPIHNIIEFNENEDLDRAMWKLIQTPPFQRLRRIKQLGFSELTFPGATHSRYAHSIGVYHTARKLMGVIEESHDKKLNDTKVKVALAAALLHDIGHGMFSHAFEKVGEDLDLGSARHETVSEQLIIEDPIASALKEAGIDPKSVASVIGRKGPADLYDAVVSSQFDADRLDYLRRDRFMAGVQSCGIDFPWLLNNLEIGEIGSGSEDSGINAAQSPAKIETFVLGPKAIMGAEAYVLALFQLYPTIYLHKTTRSAEMVFKSLMIRVLTLIRDENKDLIGRLSTGHPFVRFVKEPNDRKTILALDDTVFWGSLSTLKELEDEGIKKFSESLLERKLPKTRDNIYNIDIENELKSYLDSKLPNEDERIIDKERTQILTTIENRFEEWNKKNANHGPRILWDVAERDPYSLSLAKGELNRIYIRTSSGEISDIRNHSPVIKSLRTIKIPRAFIFDDDPDAKKFLDQTINDLRGSKLV